MAGLDPAIHPLRKILFELAGSRGMTGCASKAPRQP
jgi:hypothetical protein